MVDVLVFCIGKEEKSWKYKATGAFEYDVIGKRD